MGLVLLINGDKYTKRVLLINKLFLKSSFTSVWTGLFSKYLAWAGQCQLRSALMDWQAEYRQHIKGIPSGRGGEEQIKEFCM